MVDIFPMRLLAHRIPWTTLLRGTGAAAVFTKAFSLAKSPQFLFSSAPFDQNVRVFCRVKLQEIHGRKTTGRNRWLFNNAKSWNYDDWCAESPWLASCREFWSWQIMEFVHRHDGVFSESLINQKDQIHLVPDAPCMEYLPTFTLKVSKNYPNVGEYSTHGASGGGNSQDFQIFSPNKTCKHHRSKVGKSQDKKHQWSQHWYLAIDGAPTHGQFSSLSATIYRSWDPRWWMLNPYSYPRIYMGYFRSSMTNCEK